MKDLLFFVCVCVLENGKIGHFCVTGTFMGYVSVTLVITSNLIIVLYEYGTSALTVNCIHY